LRPPKLIWGPAKTTNLNAINNTDISLAKRDYLDFLLYLNVAGDFCSPSSG